jgi:glycosyltransferase involved in cell wall biosynthesis
LVDPEFPTQIAQAVDRLLSDRALYRQMSQRALWLVEHEYNWQRESQKLLRVYDSLAATK